MKLSTATGVLLALFLHMGATGQQDRLQVLEEHLQKEFPDLGVDDVQNLHVDAQHTSSLSGVHHMYLNQMVNGIRIKNSTINASFNKDNELINLNGNPIHDIAGKYDTDVPSYTLYESVKSIIDKLGIESEILITNLEEHTFNLVLEAGNYNHETKAELIYWESQEGELDLAWNFDISLPNQMNWYDFIVDAQDGKELERTDWQLNCSHPQNHSVGIFHHCSSDNIKKRIRTTLDGSVYNVFPFPVESPNHGNRQLLVEPANSLASPFGWHDTNGQPGHEHTITRGNNVFAYEDAASSNSPGFSPNGGNDLTFDYSLNIANNPDTYQEASVTNLFYTNNVIHDVLYTYGFDEASGNFQANNYGNGGFAGDELRAEAQDGSGVNNANMATPNDGSNPRMQMFLWTTGVSSGSFTIDAPESLAGAYASSAASSFGPAFPIEGMTGSVKLIVDDTSPANNGCSELLNSEEINGNIALVFRGGCNFTDKVLLAQEAGATAVIIINNVIGADPTTPNGTADGIVIPSMMITLELGQSMIAALENDEVIVTLVNSDGSTLIDSSFDNGIIVHEYVHGLSTRLTGGANNSGCLFGEEQMGEGWSDFYAIMMTMDLSVDNPVFRPMGTFAAGEPVDGNGIRPVPYDTSFSVNSFTYSDLPNQNVSVPHGVGFIWCTMLWDMTWLLIDEFGFDPDLMNGSGGNNVALELVTEALKLQPCQPGFVDGRDAILLADQLLYDGIHECLIWRAFAKRGLGVSASQGSTDDRSDGTAAFDVPPGCQEVFNPPTAAFSVSSENTCTGVVSFFDESEDVPQAWFWEFGDGNTSSEQNPVHLYENPGEYTVSLTVSNTLGEDNLVNNNIITFSFPEEPNADAVSGCVGDQIELLATSPDGNNIRWLDQEGQQVAIGESLEIQIGEQSTTYFAQNFIELPEIGFVGPENNEFGGGGNHGTDFIGAIFVQTFEPLVIESALVYSGAIGTRNISLFSGTDTDQSPIETFQVEVDFTGEGRIDLDIELLEPGIYSLGLNQADLYRNNSGADYPYDLSGIASIVGGSAGDDFYYYFYDVEVSTLGCVSEATEVLVEIVGEANFTFEDDDLNVSFTDISPDATSWFWDFGDGNTSTEQNPIHTYESIGEYVVTLTVDDGCSVTMTVPVGLTSIEETTADIGLSIYPNPTSDILWIENEQFGNRTIQARLIDVQGKILKSSIIDLGKSEWDLRELSAGVFFLQVTRVSDNHPIWTRKVTVIE